MEQLLNKNFSYSTLGGYALFGGVATYASRFAGSQLGVNLGHASLVAPSFYLLSLQEFVQPLLSEQASTGVSFINYSLCALTLTGEAASILGGKSGGFSKKKTAQFHAANEMIALAAFVVTIAAAVLAAEGRALCAFAAFVQAGNFANKFYLEAPYLREALSSRSSSGGPLPSYLRNVTAEVKDRKIEYVGGEKFLPEVLGIFSLQIQSNNPCLVGPASSGKTTFVDYLASEINQGHIDQFKGWEVYATTSKQIMAAGALYVGAKEKAVEELFGSLKGRKAILFIDEIHGALSDGMNGLQQDGSIAESLLIHLVKRDVFVIVGTTPIHYEKLKGNEPFRQRFTRIHMPEVNKELIGDIFKLHRNHLRKQFPSVALPENYFDKVMEINQLIGEKGRANEALFHKLAEKKNRKPDENFDTLYQAEIDDYVRGRLTLFSEKGGEIPQGFNRKLIEEKDTLNLGFGGEAILLQGALKQVYHSQQTDLNVALDQTKQELQKQ